MSVSKAFSTYTQKEIGGVTDQNTLFAIAREATNLKSKCAAIEKIQIIHQSFFENLAKNDPDPHVRCTAVAKLYDEKVLKQVEETDKNRGVREAAQHRLGALLELKLRREGNAPVQTTSSKSAQSI